MYIPANNYHLKYIIVSLAAPLSFLQLDIALAFHRGEPNPFSPVKVIIIIESPIGLINLKEICQFGTGSAKHLRLVGLTFGSDDFLARLGKYPPPKPNPSPLPCILILDCECSLGTSAYCVC